MRQGFRFVIGIFPPPIRSQIDGRGQLHSLCEDAGKHVCVRSRQTRRRLHTLTRPNLVDVRPFGGGADLAMAQLRGLFTRCDDVQTHLQDTKDKGVQLQMQLAQQGQSVLSSKITPDNALQLSCQSLSDASKAVRKARRHDAGVPESQNHEEDAARLSLQTAYYVCSIAGYLVSFSGSNSGCI